MTTFIYTLSDPNTNQIRYVGKSDYPEYRLKKHCQINLDTNKGTRKEKWIRSLLRDDKFPILEIIDEVDECEWQLWEIYWISQIRTWGFDLTNLDDGGYGGSRGRKIKDSTREKLKLAGEKGKGKKWAKESIEKRTLSRKIKNEEKKALKNIHDIFFNASGEITEKEKKIHKKRFMSEETKKKISESKKGKTFKINKPRSEEYRKKQAVSHQGKTVSEETKDKIRIASRSRIKSEEEKQKLRVANTGKIKSEETKKKISESCKGKKRAPFSEETKLKMSEAAKNRKNKQ